MEHVLGKITASCEEPSGPDVMLDIVVDRQWLKDARTIEIDLPRHLCCAACHGAGCDVCEQSGAITARDRAELAEVLRVTLPTHDFDAPDSTDSTRGLTLKVPGYGGLPNSTSSTVLRGRLLLRITTSGPVSSCVREMGDAASGRSSAPNRPNAVVPEPRSSTRELQSESPHRSVPGKSLPCAADVISTDPDEPPLTKRSFSPSAQVTPPVALAARGLNQLDRERIAVEPSIDWTWRDTVIGLAVLILGGVVARLLF